LRTNIVGITLDAIGDITSETISTEGSESGCAGGTGVVRGAGGTIGNITLHATSSSGEHSEASHAVSADLGLLT
jgi:hypothetical protein